MATLSLPTNTPTPDGAIIGCTTDDTTETAYGMVRDDRQWYFEVSANPLVTQAMIDADKATIIAQDITASELVWAGTDVDLTSVELTVTGLAENAGPFYVGWVQTVDETIDYGNDLAMEFTIAADGETLTIPTRSGTYNGFIDWGDETGEDAITTTTNPTHEYASAGVYSVRIRGTFPGLYFNNGGDRLKLARVMNLGVVGWTHWVNVFSGCSNMTEFVAGTTSRGTATDMSSMLLNCSGLTKLDLSGVDLTGITTAWGSFSGCSSIVDDVDFTGVTVSDSMLNMTSFFQNWSSCTSPPNVTGWDTSNVTSFGNMWSGWTAGYPLDARVDTWSIAACTTTSGWMGAGGLTTERYDAVLAAWAPQTPPSSLVLAMGISKYTSAASADRTTLLGKISNIVDGGMV